MWQPKTVERALFGWDKWRRSIVSQWADPDSHQEALSHVQLEDRAKQELSKLALPSHRCLELYWTCCITSDYRLDYPTSFDNIVAPPWVGPSGICGYKRGEVIRALPPFVLDEADIRYEQRYFPVDEDQLLPGQMFLPQGHKFYAVLNQVRGRPRNPRKIGGHPSYSDRLAAQCAALKDSGMTYVEIARRLGLPVSMPWESEQSDTARHLALRGKKLVAELRHA